MAVGLTIPFGCGVTLPTARDGGRGKDGMNFAQARADEGRGCGVGGHRTLPSPAPIPTGGRGSIAISACTLRPRHVTKWHR